MRGALPLRVLLVAASAAAVTACGSTDAPTATRTPAASETTARKPSATGTTAEPSPPASTKPAPKDTGVVVQMTITGHKVTPVGDRVDAKVGEPVTFKVTSDRPGGLHVHSDPEQTPEFKAGSSTVRVTIDKPGLVDVEEHEADQVLVQLEVR